MSVGWDDEGRGWFDDETGEEVDPTMCDREDCNAAHDLDVSCAVAQEALTAEGLAVITDALKQRLALPYSTFAQKEPPATMELSSYPGHILLNAMVTLPPFHHHHVGDIVIDSLGGIDFESSEPGTAILNVGDRPHNAADEIEREGSVFPIGQTDAAIDENHLQDSRSGKPREPKPEYYLGPVRFRSSDPTPVSCYVCTRPSYMDEGADGRCRSCGGKRNLHSNYPGGQGCFLWNPGVTIVCPSCRAAEGLEDRRQSRIFPDSKNEVVDNEFLCFDPGRPARRPLPHFNEWAEAMAEIVRRRLGAK